MAQQHEHEFFDPMQALILAYAQGCPALTGVAQSLGLPRLDGHPLQAAMLLTRDLAIRASPTDRFRRFAAVYILSYLAALPHADLTVDMDRLSADPGYRSATAGAVRRLGNVTLDFADAQMPLHADPDVDLRPALAEIQAALPQFPMPHGAEPGEAEARAMIARKFREDTELLGS